MAAVMTISFHDDTHEEIEFNSQNGRYWKICPQGIMIKTEGVKGSRTVYPWHSIRKYHIETEAGQRDRERRAEERERAQYPHIPLHGSGPMGGCGHVREQADPGLRRPPGDVAGGAI